MFTKITFSYKPNLTNLEFYCNENSSDVLKKVISKYHVKKFNSIETGLFKIVNLEGKIFWGGIHLEDVSGNFLYRPLDEFFNQFKNYEGFYENKEELIESFVRKYFLKSETEKNLDDILIYGKTLFGNEFDLSILKEISIKLEEEDITSKKKNSNTRFSFD